MRAVNVLLAVLVSLTMAIFVLEGGLRLVGMAPPKSSLRHDPVTGWSNEPGALLRKKSNEFDVELAFNELGLRGDPMPSPEKPPGVFRVLCLGDSFTLGYTVRREDLFVDQLQQRWRAEGRTVEVLNAGTEGWSTDQEVAWFLAHGERFQPDLVLLFPYENDIYWNAKQDYLGTDKPRFHPLEAGEEADGKLEERTLRDTSRRSFWSRLALSNVPPGSLFVKRPAAPTFRPAGGEREILEEWAPLLGSPPPIVADAVARTRGALKALESKCDSLGADLVVAPIPSHSAVDPAHRAQFGRKVLGLAPELWSPDRPVETFLSLCEELGIRWIDCRPVLKERIAAGEKLYYDRDWHLNAAGNAVFGEWLFGKLEEIEFGAAPSAVAGPVAGGNPASPSGAERPARWPFVFLALWLLLSTMYLATYRDEPRWRPPLAVGALLAVIFAIVLGGEKLISALPPAFSQVALVLFVALVLGFVVYKLGRRVATIAELLVSFTMRGHWYLMPLVVVLLTIGSLLVVAASSPLVAPFIYTLF